MARQDYDEYSQSPWINSRPGEWETWNPDYNDDYFDPDEVDEYDDEEDESYDESEDDGFEYWDDEWEK